ncbi:IS701 family transposase [Streptomyces antarcticus]|uniref:IS701 family transposase n=1 Tax=Streptomyces antarcticus TaxID=2996458 RepID=UPI00226D6F8D|nr:MULTISPECIES: transposase [unclassified Streptomyces]MCY0942898.1 transposase [Streptomyces sp. H34-AA3]MCZ4083142.1 transposase [Streptomyces sp. H34-S5]
MVMHALMSSKVSMPAFTERVFEGLPRMDQRRWAQMYVQSLLTTPGKKSVRRLAAAVSDSPTASQSLHQFVNASPWDWAPVRSELARWTEQETTPRAWLLDLAVLRKRGEHSCGVHRRFVPSTGRSVTCQVGVGGFLATRDGAVPVDWRLLLPGSWTKDPERRQRTRIPDDAGQRSLEQHALDVVDTLAGATRTAPVPVVADLGESAGAARLVRGLSQRGRDFVVAVPGSLQVLAGRHLRLHRPEATDGKSMLIAARSLFEFDATGLTRIETVGPWGGGPGRHHTVMSSFVRLPDPASTGMQVHRTYRLFAVASERGRQPVKLWLTNLTHARTEEVLALTGLLDRSAETVRELEDDFGLLDFEGRSYPGWHHHMTLVSAAYAYDRLGRPGGGGGEPLLQAA